MESVLEDRLWESLFREAQTALKEGQLNKAVSDFRSAMKVCRNFPADDERTVRSMTGLGVAYSMQQDFASAMPLFEQALRHTQQMKGPGSAENLSLLKQLAVATSAVKDFVASASYYDQAIAIYSELSPDHPDVKVLRERRNESLKMLEKQKQNAVNAAANTAGAAARASEDSYEKDARSMQVLSGRKGPVPPPASTGSAPGVGTAGGAASQSTMHNLEQTGSLLHGMLIDNKYQVISAVGEGGMGTIFAGKHVALERDVAIKVMQKKAIYDESDRERFRQEAKLLSKLMHPNIVSVHDFGETATFYYLIMDFVDGECLSARIAKFGRIDVEETVNMLVQLCDGLAHAHVKGILHRDLKPSNVMLVKQGDRPDLVKLVDFGIAKSLNQTEEEMQLTHDGETIGSPLYMSPEQCRGEALDTRSDIYSLGCLAYKALTGVTPFTGKNHFEIYIKHTQEMPAPFAEVAGAARVPAVLENILFKCLAKQPADRYSSMLELKSALEQL